MKKEILFFVFVLLAKFSFACDRTLTTSDLFTSHGNQIYTQLSTTKMWTMCDDESCLNSNLNWGDAVQRAEESTFAGFSDWRLPNIKELVALTSLCEYEARIPTAFLKNDSKIFWSSTPSAIAANEAWSLFVKGSVGDYDNVVRSDEKTDLNTVIFVRDVVIQ